VEGEHQPADRRQGMHKGQLRSDLSPFALIIATFLLGVLPQLAHRRVTASQLPIAAALPGTGDAAQMMLDILLNGIAAGHGDPKPPS